MPKRIIISVISDLQSDQRVLRICETLHENGFQVLLIGRKTKTSTALNMPYTTKRLSMLFERGFGFYAEFNFRILWILISQRKSLLYANDLDTLLANYIASRLDKVPLVYDSHEYFTEVPELMSRPRSRSFWLFLERMIFPHLKHVVTVNQRLAQIYSSKYKVPVSVIRNVPKVREKEMADDTSSSGNSDKMLIYQGSLNLGRGIELMIDAMIHLKLHHLWIVGEGDISEALKQRVEKKSLGDRVVFKGRVAPESLAELTEKAVLGFSLEEDMGDNYRYALPNKIFDYLQAGIPSIVSDLPVMGDFVRDNHVGEVLTSRNPEALAQLVEQVCQHRNSYRPSIAKAADVFNWNNESIRFLNLIENVEQ